MLVLALGVALDGTLAIRSVISIPVVLAALVLFCLFAMGAAVLVASVLDDGEYVVGVTNMCTLALFFLTGYNGLLPAMAPGPLSDLVNVLPNSLATRLAVYHLVPVGSGTGTPLVPPALPTGATSALLLVGYAVAGVVLGAVLMRRHIYDGEGASDVSSDLTPAVETTDLAKAFDGDPVFDGVDLTLRRGETTLLMGPNGGGKTVLLSCLAGGLKPSAGSVSVFGDPPADARSRLVFMLQDGLVIDELSGRENAAFYASLHPRATDQWRELVDRLELDALDRRVTDYSGGMRQKLALALTLSVDVPLYLLDEPTAALDPTSVERFHAMLDELADAGRTVVVTSHSPRDIRAADRLVFFGSGGVVADGDPVALREATPPVVVVDDTVRDPPTGVLRNGRLFDTDAGRRGFLAAEVDPEAVADRDDVYAVESATAADVFDYYVHLQP
ncbi:ATP-binding cassette domain-containing protein [Halobaculum litoreum]|uniref:ATP-binding cassette domain-containing protein n=1 Tax=Halobaculum litoreum TaxID=3031998 RepID=A0ABD5XSH2_9EURY